MALRLCLDTYALIEIYKGNTRFSDLLNASVVICDLTLAEFFGVILREKGENEARYWVRQFEQYVVHVELATLFNAVKFRQENRKKRYSFFDAVGYVYSLEHGFEFVTGDEGFRGMNQVDFRKAA
jgi:predicted nucleic acid-binding protein